MLHMFVRQAEHFGYIVENDEKPKKESEIPKKKSETPSTFLGNFCIFVSNNSHLGGLLNAVYSGYSFH